MLSFDGPMRRKSSVMVTGLIAIACVVGGCSREEKSRPLSFEPGVYRGDKLPALSDDEQKKLQQRGTLQR
jgi:hypothetical protein